MFLKTIDEEEATGAVAEIYAEEKREAGLIMAATRCWTARPDLLPAFTDFFEAVKGGFTLSPRDWRLITFIAALEVPSTYCALVYGGRLVDDLGSQEAVVALRNDFRTAGLSARDVAMLAFAQKTARSAHTIRQDDIDALRSHGFSDAGIADIALCASVRAFMSRYFEATGAGPEARFTGGDPEFIRALTVGRAVPS